jgi:hypothetical protein
MASDELEGPDLITPVYVIRHGGERSFVCIPGESPTDGLPVNAVAIFTKPELAAKYREDAALEGAKVVGIQDQVALRQFLEGFQPPTVGVALDLVLENGRPTAQWYIPIAEALEKLTPPNTFIWDYPVFVIAERQGAYSSIDGNKPDGTKVILLAAFTDRDLAERYQEKADIQGKVEVITNRQAFSKLMNSMQTAGVAWDASTADQGRIVKSCMDKADLLNLLGS